MLNAQRGQEERQRRGKDEVSNASDRNVEMYESMPKESQRMSEQLLKEKDQKDDFFKKDEERIRNEREKQQGKDQRQQQKDR